MTIKRRLVFLSALLLLAAGVVMAFLFTARKSPEVSYTVYPVEQGWGYDIAVEGRVFIHQPFIPAVEGMRPFPDEKSAENVARYVARKIRAGEHPALTKTQVDSLLTDR